MLALRCRILELVFAAVNSTVQMFKELGRGIKDEYRGGICFSYACLSLIRSLQALYRAAFAPPFPLSTSSSKKKDGESPSPIGAQAELPAPSCGWSWSGSALPSAAGPGRAPRSSPLLAQAKLPAIAAQAEPRSSPPPRAQVQLPTPHHHGPSPAPPHKCPPPPISAPPPASHPPRRFLRRHASIHGPRSPRRSTLGSSSSLLRK